MAVKLPDLAPIDYTALDLDSIIALTDTLIREHPEYFSGSDDFQQSNAGKFVIDLVAYVVDLLANRVDWVANELTLPTATQKQNVINLNKSSKFEEVQIEMNLRESKLQLKNELEFQQAICFYP